MPYNVLDVSQYVIKYSNEQDYGISNLKLQKILYFIQVYFLLEKDEPCFDDKIEAWDIGPVIPDVYDKYKQYANGGIPTEDYFIIDKNNVWDSKRAKYQDIITDADKQLINKVVDKFADRSVLGLTVLTQKQSPWINAYNQKHGNEITTHALRLYFCDIFANKRKEN